MNKSGGNSDNTYVLQTIITAIISKEVFDKKMRTQPIISTFLLFSLTDIPSIMFVIIVLCWDSVDIFLLCSRKVSNKNLYRYILACKQNIC